MRSSLSTRAARAALSRASIKALRSPPSDDDADEDDWEAIEPDPTELDDWDESLSDDDLDCGPDEDDDWPADDDWRDFDQADDDDDDDDDL